MTPHRYLQLDGKPAFLLGVNYWSRAGGPRMWDRFDPSTVRRELRQMRAIGLDVCRSFCFIPDFMPRPPQVSRVMLPRLRQFLDLCQAERIHTIPSFLVGHMSGENHDFPGQRGRCLYSDPDLLRWQSALVHDVAEVCADHPAVAAYLASNEMPNWTGAADPALVTSWGRSMRDAVRSQDPRRPFSLGDGVMNLGGGDNGFDPLLLSDVVDFFGPHSYRVDTDPLRQALTAEYCIRSLTHLGLPVLLEEFGCSSSQASEKHQALYYREAIHTCLGAGGAGALGWCYSDLDLEHEPPYAHHAFELEFGITRRDGSEKPVCDELRRIAGVVAQLDIARLRPPRPRTAIIVPSYFNTSYPFSHELRPRMQRTLLQSYVLCAAAGIEAELVPEQSIDLSRYQLVLAPATQKLLAPTWRALLSWVRQGNTLYWSYFFGDDGFLQGAWCQLFQELTGCRHLLRYGCVDPPPDPMRLDGAGLSLEQAVAGTACGRVSLEVEATTARVLATDGRGRPALLRQEHQAGRVLFLAAPLEYYIAEQRMSRDCAAHELYRLVAREAGIASPTWASDPRVQLRTVEVEGESPLLWVMNHAWDNVAVELDVPRARPLHDADGDLVDGHQTIQLAPKQMAVYRYS